MREAKRNCLSEKGREYRGSNAVYNGRSFGARVWTGENNSEQHSCPTRLNSSLQLHFPCIRLLPLIYSVLSHSPLSSVLFTTRCKIGRIFHFLRGRSDSSFIKPGICPHRSIVRPLLAHATLLNSFPPVPSRTTQLILSVLMEVSRYNAC